MFLLYNHHVFLNFSAYWSCSGPKLMGRSSFKVLHTISSFFPENMKIGTFGENSRMNWRQIPQGLIGSTESPRIAIAWSSLEPSIIHLVMAVLSAQMPAPYRAFSTLAPVTMEPSFVRMAHPTLELVRDFEWCDAILTETWSMGSRKSHVPEDTEFWGSELVLQKDRGSSCALITRRDLTIVLIGHVTYHVTSHFNILKTRVPGLFNDQFAA